MLRQDERAGDPASNGQPNLQEGKHVSGFTRAPARKRRTHRFGRAGVAAAGGGSEATASAGWGGGGFINSGLNERSTSGIDGRFTITADNLGPSVLVDGKYVKLTNQKTTRLNSINVA